MSPTLPDSLPLELQYGDLPFDLALKRGCSFSLLALLQPGSAAWLDGGVGLQQPDRPLVSAAESRVFASLSHLLDPNPRRLKRIISVYALVTEVAKRMPLSDGDSKASYPNPGFLGTLRPPEAALFF